jgi:hypothetical protein
MLNVNLPILVLCLGGCFLYVSAMSALGRWLAACRESTSVAYIAPVSRGGFGA